MRRQADTESERVATLAGWYVDEQLAFDQQLIAFRYRAMKPYLRGPEGLELGCGGGEMTRRLVRDFARLTVVEGASTLLERLPRAENLVKVCSLFEAFAPGGRFDSILMDHVLEHVEDPVGLLRRAADWLAPGGRLLVGVPNGHSFHRLAGVKLGLLGEPCELNARDVALGHRRVYTPASLRRDMESAGLSIIDAGGVFLKPLSNRQIQEQWTAELIEAFYELGRDFPDFAADIFAVCRPARGDSGS